MSLSFYNLKLIITTTENYFAAYIIYYGKREREGREGGRGRKTEGEGGERGREREEEGEGGRGERGGGGRERGRVRERKRDIQCTLHGSPKTSQWCVHPNGVHTGTRL